MTRVPPGHRRRHRGQVPPVGCPVTCYCSAHKCGGGRCGQPIARRGLCATHLAERVRLGGAA